QPDDRSASVPLAAGCRGDRSGPQGGAALAPAGHRHDRGGAEPARGLIAACPDFSHCRRMVASDIVLPRGIHRALSVAASTGCLGKVRKAPWDLGGPWGAARTEFSTRGECKEV